ncbi:MAG: XTP/dITP diphosphatase [Deltaproteobacteria bacterium]|nr:XTP/dITP diphosphatase [Deltaproteobacteria bacterium]
MQHQSILVIATRNKGKTKEIKDLLKDFPVDIKDIDDFGPIPHMEEDGDTFDENAYKKASFAARILGFPALADDSGLTVEALKGAPGIHSAKLLSEMEGMSNRKAAFECVISIAVPTGPALTYEARCEGLITQVPAGSKGFGYDPIFYYPPYKKTFAELTRQEKNRVSHRGKAFAELKDEFDKVLIWIRQNMPVQEKRHG